MGVQPVDVGIVDRLQREVLLAIHLPDIFGHVAQQAVVLVGRELCDTGADLLLSFFAVFREFSKEESGGAARILEPLLDGEAVRYPALPNQSVVGRQDIGPIAVYDAVDLQGYLVPMQGAFQTLVPALGLNLAAGVDFG